MSKRWLVAWAVGLAAAICVPAWAKPSGPLPPGRSAFGRLRAGAAKVAITPTSPVWMGGWGENRRMEGVHDDVWARALYLTDGRTQLVLVGLDLVGLMKTDQAPILEAVAAEVGTNVFMSNTHTHSGPDVIGLWGPDEETPGWDAAYIAYAQGRIIEAILAAKANAQPARLYCGSALTTTEDRIAWNANERSFQADSPPWEPGRGRGPQDYEVAVMRVETRPEVEGQAPQTIATVFNFACHPEVAGGNHQDMTVWKYISSDIGNYAYDQVEQAVGGVTIWLQGGCGAMVTVDIPSSERNWTSCERIGRALGDRILEGVAGADLERNPQIACASTELNVPLYNRSLYYGMLLGLVRSGPGRMADNSASPIGKGVLTRVSMIRIGELQLASTPGEIYPKIALNIKQQILTAPHRMVLGLCQDELGYILYPADYGTSEYEYETSMCVGPTMGLAVEAGLQEALGNLP